MAFPDTQATKTVSTFTTSAAVTPLPRISSLGQKSEYGSSDGSLKMTIAHTVRPNTSQRLVKMEQRLLVPDPLVSGASRYVDHSVWVVIKSSSPLITTAQQKTLVENLVAWLGDSSFANTNKVLGGES